MAYRAASPTNRSRRLNMNGSAATSNAWARLSTAVAKATSISSSLLPGRARRVLNIAQLAVELNWQSRIEQHADQRSVRYHLAQEAQALAFHCGEQRVDSGRIAAGPVEAGDKSLLHRVGAADKDDRYGCG